MKTQHFAAGLASAAIAAVLSSGCWVIYGDYAVGGGGFGGATTSASSSGGTAGTTTATGSGGTAGTGGTTGTGGNTASTTSSTESTTTTAPPTCTTPGGTTCADPAQCPAAAECKHATCDTGTHCCGEANDDNGVTAKTQVKGDCKVVVCDGSGGTTQINDNADLPDDANDCSVGACNAGAPVQNPKSLGVACTSGGGKFCDGAGSCVQCNADADCAGTPGGKTACNAHTCVTPACNDNKQDGLETDVDCGGIAGGSGCAKCADTKGCAVDTDCANGWCHAGVCATPTCGDNFKNGSETDTDCGGTTCVNAGKTCGTGKGCSADTDCTSLSCSSSKCVAATCADGKTNGGESDKDCGAVCGTGGLCPNGKLCNGGNDCQSGVCNSGICGTLPLGTACTSGVNCATGAFCTDGVCCSSSACSTCQACSAVLKKDGLANGQCNAVKDGTDPHTSCPIQAASTCGNTGVCTSGACAKFAAGTACGTSATCSGSTFTPAQTCPGGGAACFTVTPGACPNSLICANATSCKTSCSADTDCAASGLFCNSSHNCAAKLADGGTCSGNNQCTSNNCVSGICATACTQNSDCTSGMCYSNVCVPSINGCNIATATDLTTSTTTTVDFGGTFGLTYSPKCIKVKANTVITFNGNFSSHPLQGGADVLGTGIPATSGPFATVTNTGTSTPFTMSAQGTFPYYCVAHVSAGMEGAVFVVP